MTHSSGVQHQFLLVWKYVTYVTTLRFSIYCLIPLMIHHRVFYNITKLIYVLNRHTDTSLSTIEFIGSYEETMSNCQSIFTFVK